MASLTEHAAIMAHYTHIIHAPYYVAYIAIVSSFIDYEQIKPVDLLMGVLRGESDASPHIAIHSGR